MEQVTALLRQIRRKRGMSQKQLADAIGLSIRQFSRWEKGSDSGAIKGDALLRIIALLRVPFDDIITHLDLDMAEELQKQAALTAEEQQIIAQLSPKQRAAVLEVARQMIQQMSHSPPGRPDATPEA